MRGLRKREAGALLAVCLAGALGLRVWGMWQGYPEFYGHVDEIGVAASIWNFFREGTLRPTEFTYPAFYSYFVAAGIWVSGLTGMVGEGASGLLDRLVLVSYIDPAWSALVGRSISAVASTLSVLLVYLLGRQVDSTRTGCIGALFAAVAVVPATQAHTALPDCTMAFLATLCLYLSWRVYLTGSWRSYLLAGACAGLVVATKYNGAFVSFGLVAAHLSRGRREGSAPTRLVLAPKMIAAVAVAAVALTAASPYLLLARDQYLGVARYQVSSLSFSLSESAPWWWVVRGFIETEWVLGALMLASLGWAIVRRDPLDLILLAAWVPSFIYIGSWTRQSLHYLLHFYPILALSAARLVDRLAEDGVGGGNSSGTGAAAGVWSRLTPRTALFALLIVACAVPNAWRIAARDRQLAWTDTREMAAAWIRTNVPGGTAVAMTWLPYCPKLDLETTRDGLRRYFHRDRAALAALARAWESEPAYRLVNLEVWRSKPRVPEFYRDKVDLTDPETRRVFSRGWRSLSQLRRMGVEYLVLPDAVFQRYLEGVPPSSGTAAHYRYTGNAQYFQQLLSPQSGLVQVAEFSAGDMGSARARGGDIRVYRMSPEAGSAP